MAWKKSRRAAQDLPGLDESESSQGTSICGTASKASQSMSHSRKNFPPGTAVGAGEGGVPMMARGRAGRAGKLRSRLGG